MHFWFARDSAVTLREQLVTQVVLAFLSDDLRPGQRLPSTRELARRFHLHPNTVSAGYRQLARDRWVHFRHGSGVFVRDTKPQSALSPSLALDQLVGNVFRFARKQGIPFATVRSRLRHWSKRQPPDHFLLIEPDDDLRKILAVEMQQVLTLPVKTCAAQSARISSQLPNAIPVVLAGKEKLLEHCAQEGTESFILQIGSVPASLEGWLPAPPGVLIGIASRLPRFLKLTRTMLIAAGFQPDSLLFRDARRGNWQRGLSEASAVVCDSATSPALPKNIRAIPFPLLSEDALNELRRYEQFLLAR